MRLWTVVNTEQAWRAAGQISDACVPPPFAAQVPSATPTEAAQGMATPAAAATAATAADGEEELLAQQPQHTSAFTSTTTDNGFAGAPAVATPATGLGRGKRGPKSKGAAGPPSMPPSQAFRTPGPLSKVGTQRAGGSAAAACACMRAYIYVCVLF